MAESQEKTGAKDIRSRLDSYERAHAELQNAESYYKFFGCCSDCKWHPRSYFRRLQTCKACPASTWWLATVFYRRAAMNTVYYVIPNNQLRLLNQLEGNTKDAKDIKPTAILKHTASVRRSEFTESTESNGMDQQRSIYSMKLLNRHIFSVTKRLVRLNKCVIKTHCCHKMQLSYLYILTD